ncbi:MAG: hypothetical protein AB7L94_43850 [Kofleriaceae bacterium]
MTALLNIDLDLTGEQPFDTLHRELEQSLFTLYEEVDEGGTHHASYETNLASINNPDEVLGEFVRVLDGLGAVALAQWRSLDERVFDLGVRAEVPSSHVEVSPTMLQAIGRLGAQLVITTYPPDPVAAPEKKL